MKEHLYRPVEEIANFPQVYVPSSSLIELQFFSGSYDCQE